MPDLSDPQVDLPRRSRRPAKPVNYVEPDSLIGSDDELSDFEDQLDAPRTPPDSKLKKITTFEQTPKRDSQASEKPEMANNIMILQFVHTIAEASRYRFQFKVPTRLEWLPYMAPLKVVARGCKCTSTTDGSLYLRSKDIDGEWRVKSWLLYASIEVIPMLYLVFWPVR